MKNSDIFNISLTFIQNVAIYDVLFAKEKEKKS